MKRLVLSLLGLVTIAARAALLGEPLVFTGTCDASAAIALSGDLFVVANDEDNVLRFYRPSLPGKPVQQYDLNPILSTTGKSREMDLEGATRLGDRVFFISSHGRNATGKAAPNRRRFFALELKEQNGKVKVKPIGKPYINLVAGLASDPRYLRFHLAEAAELPPKATGGFNIEALTGTPEGTLLIGFRSPISEGRALLAPLLNPNEVITGQPPKFGEPLLLDLGGLGLRDMTYTPKGYYLIAGPAQGHASSCLYSWAGGSTAPQMINDVHFHKFNPEGICLLGVGGGSEFLIVSDDGTRMIGGRECKSLPESERRFRVYRFTP